MICLSMLRVRRGAIQKVPENVQAMILSGTMWRILQEQQKEIAADQGSNSLSEPNVSNLPYSSPMHRKSQRPKAITLDIRSAITVRVRKQERR